MIKKLFLGSIALTLFAIAMLLFQISCQKTAEALPPPTDQYILPIATPERLGGVKPDGSTIFVNTEGIISVAPTTPVDKEDFILYSSEGSYWICNKSGSNKRKIQHPFTSGGISDMQILADGNSVVFNYLEFPVYSVYTMNFDGTNLVKILGGTTDYVEIVSTAAFPKK